MKARSMLCSTPCGPPLFPAATLSVILNNNGRRRVCFFPLLWPPSLCDYPQSVRVTGVVYVKLL